MRRLLVFALLLLGAPQTSPPPLAFKNATLQAGPGRKIANAVVLVRNGLIQEAGAGLDIPPDAKVIDAAGLFLYAGFIDGRCSSGLSDTKRGIDQLRLAEGEKPDATREAPPRMEEANRRGLRPEIDAAALISIGEEAAKKVQGAGFTVVRSALAEEYIGGRAALITLSGRPRREALIRGGAGFQGGFKNPGDGYPGTVMGFMAHARQFLLDGQHYARRWGAWKAGSPRPPLDAALEALQPLLKGEERLWMDAGSDREILRAVALADEFKLQLGVSGGAEAWKVADVLKERRIPVAYSLKVPKKPEPKKDADALPARLQEELERVWKESLTSPRKLLDQGVRLCFSSQGLDSPPEVLDAVALLVEHGLTRDEALAALTTTPAALFGLEATHGSVEKGRAANLVALTAPLGDRKTRVKYLVADGRLFEYDAKAPDSKKDEKKEDAPAAQAVPVAVELDADRIPKLRTGGTVFIKDAAVHTIVPAALLEKASVLIRAGLIVSVGKDLPVPEGVTVVDGAGLHLMPGIVDCHSHIATEGGLNEMTSSITAEVRVADALDPTDVELHRAAAAGVTAANILHGSANAIGGQNAVIRMKYGARPADLLYPGAPGGIKFALGENPKQANFPGNRGKRFPNSRMGVEAVFLRAFTEARGYESARRTDPLTRRDLRLDALLGVLNGDLRVHCHCYRSEEIAMILQAAKVNGFKVSTLQHVLEGYRVMPEILASGAGASTFSDWWAYKIEAYEAIPHNAAMMSRAGILTSINSDLPHQIRHLTVEAAKAVKYGGLSDAEALALLTINPAKQLGIEASCGSVEPGKRADLALYNGHPLSPYSRCVLTLIDGEAVFDARQAVRNSTPDFRAEQRPRREPGPLVNSGFVAITGARLFPVTAPSFVGTLLLKDGKIAALGADLQVPAGAAVLDAKGLSVYPGLIDAHTSLGLNEIGSVAGTRDETEIGLIQPDLKALHSVHPHSELIPVTRANGITSALTRPEGGLISGQSALIRLAGWTPSEMSIQEAVALHVDMPEKPDGDDADARKEFERRSKLLKDTFEAAKRQTVARRDLKLDALQPYLKGERPVVFHASRAKEIREALKLAVEFGLKPVISGGQEAWKVAKELYEHRASVILAGTLGIPLEPHDPADAVASNAAKLSQAGVPFAISAAESFQGNSRNTPYHAAWASAHGLGREEALKSVTIRAAEILGVSARTGSLEAGKDADLIITTGDPLEVATDVVWMFIAGRAVSLDSKHTRLHEKFKGRK